MKNVAVLVGMMWAIGARADTMITDTNLLVSVSVESYSATQAKGGIQHTASIKITNRSTKPLWWEGNPPNQVFYEEYALEGGHWKLRPIQWAVGPGGGRLELKPGKSLSFSVPVTAHDVPKRLGFVYHSDRATGEVFVVDSPLIQLPDSK